LLGWLLKKNSQKIKTIKHTKKILNIDENVDKLESCTLLVEMQNCVAAMGNNGISLKNEKQNWC